MNSLELEDMVKEKISSAIDSGLYNPNKFHSALHDIPKTADSILMNTVSFKQANLLENLSHNTVTGLQNTSNLLNNNSLINTDLIPYTHKPYRNLEFENLNMVFMSLKNTSKQSLEHLRYEFLKHEERL